MYSETWLRPLKADFQVTVPSSPIAHLLGKWIGQGGTELTARRREEEAGLNLLYKGREVVSQSLLSDLFLNHLLHG